ncbi:MAG: hypothetical protein U0T74_01435 [Chitinophagales bacterium]
MSQLELLKQPSFEVLGTMQSSFLRTLLYFDIFNYPLTIEEIFCYSASHTLSQVEDGIAYFVQKNWITTLNGKYFLKDRELIVQIREDLNKRAGIFYKKANRYTKLISRFPFVRGVLITGSLSKGCMETNGDIDYLIITQPGRLWLCRTLLTVFKKTVLFNSRKYFCVNYYLTADSLYIPDHNLFTATEITSAKPAYNESLCQHFFSANAWTSRYYPNMQQQNSFTVHEKTETLFKRFLEKVFEGKIGELADEWMMRLFVWHWKNKFKGEDKKRFDVNFRSRKNVSKHHPHGFQFKVLKNFEEKINHFELTNRVKLT